MEWQNVDLKNLIGKENIICVRSVGINAVREQGIKLQKEISDWFHIPL